jgi:hypothetical protein
MTLPLVLMYQPAGFRRPVRARRGLGDDSSMPPPGALPGSAAYNIWLASKPVGTPVQPLAPLPANNYAAVASTLTPGSAMYQLFQGCAQNPSAPQCASATAGALSTPYLTAPQESAVRVAQAAGAAPPTFASSGAAPSPPAGAGNARLSFTTSSGNTSSPAVGDSWTITISGAPAGASISVLGGQNGAQNTASMGSADGSGNWSKSGSFGAGQVGSWAEQWLVNGQPIGNWNYSVVQPTPKPQPAGFPSASDTSGSNVQTGGSAPSQSGSSFSQTALGIPIWVWALGVAGAAFAFSQQGGRYGR